MAEYVHSWGLQSSGELDGNRLKIFKIWFSSLLGTLGHRLVEVS